MLACVAAGDAETLGRRSSEIQRIADSRYLFVDDHKDGRERPKSGQQLLRAGHRLRNSGTLAKGADRAR